MHGARIRLSILLVILFISLPQSSLVGATMIPPLNEEVMDSALIEAIENNDNTTYPVIIQFSNNIDREIRSFLISHEVHFVVESDLLNGGLAQILSLIHI